MSRSEIPSFAEQLAEAVLTIEGAHARLADHVEQTICDAAGCNTLEEAISLASDLTAVDVLSEEIRRFTRIAEMRHLYSDHESWLSAVTEVVCSQSIRHWKDRDIPGHVTELRRVVTDYARVADLARFTAGSIGDSFEALQIQITSQEGRARSEIVTIPRRAMPDLTQAIESIVQSESLRLELDSAIVREALLGVLARERLPEMDVRVSPDEDQSAEEAASNE